MLEKPSCTAMELASYTAQLPKDNALTVHTVDGRLITASAQMGHTDVSTTLKIYTHLDAVHKRTSVEKLDINLERTEKAVASSGMESG